MGWQTPFQPPSVRRQGLVRDISHTDLNSRQSNAMVQMRNAGVHRMHPRRMGSRRVPRNLDEPVCHARHHRVWVVCDMS